MNYDFISDLEIKWVKIMKKKYNLYDSFRLKSIPILYNYDDNLLCIVKITLIDKIYYEQSIYYLKVQLIVY